MKKDNSQSTISAKKSVKQTVRRQPRKTLDESLLKLCNSRLYSLSFIFNPMTPSKQGQAKKNKNLAIEPAFKKKKEKKLNQQNYTQTIDA